MAHIVTRLKELFSPTRLPMAVGFVKSNGVPATAAAKRIGKVDVDHGETGCKTPDAAPYIAKAAAHRKKKRK